MTSTTYTIDSDTSIGITLDKDNGRLYFNHTMLAGHFIGLGVQNSEDDADIYGIQITKEDEVTTAMKVFDVYITGGNEVHSYTKQAYKGLKMKQALPRVSVEYYRPLKLTRKGRNQTLELDKDYKMTYVFEEQNIEDRGFSNRGYFTMRLDSNTGSVYINNSLKAESGEFVKTSA